MCQVVECGSHVELVEHRGVYHRCLECLELHGNTHVSFVYLTCLFVGVLGRNNTSIISLLMAHIIQTLSWLLCLSNSLPQDVEQRSRSTDLGEASG